MKRYPQYKPSGIKWVGDIPEHWEKNPFGRYFQYFKGLSITKADLQSEGISVISYGQIHSKQNQGTSISEDLIRFVSPAYLKTDPQSLVRRNDFIFADTSEDLDGCGNCVFVDCDRAIFAGYHTLVCRPHGFHNPIYLAYQFLSLPWRTQLRTQCNGVKVFSISRSKLKKTVLLTPPPAEQQAIVEFLDQTTAKIEEYIAAKETEIEKLGVLKQAIISRAVTRGLNPNAPMKPSGVKWIGDIPEHWKPKRLFAVAHEHYISNKNIHHQNLLSLSYGKIIRKNINTTSGLLPASFDGYQVVEKGNVVLRLTDLQNDHRSLRVGFVTETGIITSAYLCLSSRSNIFPHYLYFLLHTNDIHKVFYGMGGGLRQSLDYSELRKLPIFLPPPDEQQAIVEYINRKTLEIDGYIKKIQQQIEKLKLYKQRLISDAVTGKIDVRSCSFVEDIFSDDLITKNQFQFNNTCQKSEE